MLKRYRKMLNMIFDSCGWPKRANHQQKERPASCWRNSTPSGASWLGFNLSTLLF